MGKGLGCWRAVKALCEQLFLRFREVSDSASSRWGQAGRVPFPQRQGMTFVSLCAEAGEMRCGGKRALAMSPQAKAQRSV